MHFNDGKTLRVSLTELCNYRCFFCHEEGLDMSETRKNFKSFDEIYNRCIEAIEIGYTDITFTGGEPLIKKDWVIKFLEKFNHSDTPPSITIVTNGVLIDDDLIASIKKYKGKFKFNFSMHHINKKKYLDIVLPRNNKSNNYDIVLENIKKITSNNIRLKLNFVILKGLNNSKEDLISFMEYAKKNNVFSIKFLEFLVIPKTAASYDYHYTLEALENKIKDKLQLFETNKRTKYYKYNNSDLIVELSQCSCSVGCKHCEEVNGPTITSELKYFPCFFRNPNVQIEVNNFETAIKKGTKFIKTIADRYGEETPFLVSQGKYTRNKIEYFYIINKDVNLLKSSINTFLNENNFVRMRKLEERIYKYSKNEVVKIFRDLHSDKCIEVIKHTYLKGDELYSKFISQGKNVISDMNKYENDNKAIVVSEILVKYYKDNIDEISLGRVNNESDYYVISNKKLDLNMYPELTISDKLLEEIIIENYA